MKNRLKKIMLGLVAALFLVGGANIVSYAASAGYSGQVTKYSDFESSTMTKGTKSDNATKNETKKPAGTYETWLEWSKFGQNVTYKTSYNSTGKYYMTYETVLGGGGTCAEIIYVEKYPVRLNISTALTNFNSGTVKGTWSPDSF